MGGLDESRHDCVPGEGDNSYLFPYLGRIQQNIHRLCWRLLYFMYSFSMSRSMFLGYVPDYSMFCILIGQKDMVQGTFQERMWKQTKWNPKPSLCFLYIAKLQVDSPRFLRGRHDCVFFTAIEKVAAFNFSDLETLCLIKFPVRMDIFATDMLMHNKSWEMRHSPYVSGTHLPYWFPGFSCSSFFSEHQMGSFLINRWIIIWLVFFMLEWLWGDTGRLSAGKTTDFWEQGHSLRVIGTDQTGATCFSSWTEHILCFSNSLCHITTSHLVTLDMRCDCVVCVQLWWLESFCSQGYCE